MAPGLVHHQQRARQSTAPHSVWSGTGTAPVLARPRCWHGSRLGTGKLPSLLGGSLGNAELGQWVLMGKAGRVTGGDHRERLDWEGVSGEVIGKGLGWGGLLGKAVLGEGGTRKGWARKEYWGFLLGRFRGKGWTGLLEWLVSRLQPLGEAA